MYMLILYKTNFENVFFIIPSHDSHGQTPRVRQSYESDAQQASDSATAKRRTT